MSRVLIVLIIANGIALVSNRAEGQQNPVAQAVSVNSPDGRISIEMSASGAARYRVSVGGHPVILESRLAITLSDGSALGDNCVVEGIEKREINDQYVQHPGKRSKIINHCNEAVVSLREQGASTRRWQVLLRAYDDGVAFRYRFLSGDGKTELEIAGESDEFKFPDSTSGYALPLNSFTTSYEKRYAHKAVEDIPAEWLLGMPFLVEIPVAGWAAVTEANLTDYAGMYLAHRAGNGATMVSRLSPLPSDPKLTVRVKLPHNSPWRVIMIGQSPGRLLESDILLNLNEPRAFDDVSWIHPGKTTFPWWNGFYEKNVPFKPGLNTATAKYYIDFCAEAHIPYHSLDGIDNVAWYGGPIVPYQGADIVHGIAGLDLPDVLRYAKEKGVRMRMWMHWGAAKAHMAKAFPLYEKWGVEGVMLDFMDRDDQEMITFMREVLQTAADCHLTVTFHGVSKPTGLERTFPNLLASEGAMNYEYDKWDPIGIPPEHDLTLVFTRMLAGPMDFHQGSLRGVPVNKFKPRNEAPLVMGTPSRMLATYVVFENHLPMAADYPSAYRGNPGLPVLASIPTTWDDTKVIEGQVGKLAVVARRSGADWWIGAMAAGEGSEIHVPLKFLEKGAKFKAEITRDEPTAKYRLAQETRAVTAGDVLDLKLAPAGGSVVHLSPASK